MLMIIIKKLINITINYYSISIYYVNIKSYKISISLKLKRYILLYALCIGQSKNMILKYRKIKILIFTCKLISFSKKSIQYQKNTKNWIRYNITKVMCSVYYLYTNKNVCPTGHNI